jgi:hypothetical protein
MNRSALMVPSTIIRYTRPLFSIADTMLSFCGPFADIRERLVQPYRDLLWTALIGKLDRPLQSKSPQLAAKGFPSAFPVCFQCLANRCTSQADSLFNFPEFLHLLPHPDDCLTPFFLSIYRKLSAILSFHSFSK